MIKELGELNEQFFQLYGRLYKCKTLLAVNAEQEKYMAACLFNQYKAEYKLLLLKAEITERRELYATELRHYNMVPRKRFFFFRNRAMKQLDEKILNELEAWFEAQQSEQAAELQEPQQSEQAPEPVQEPLPQEQITESAQEPQQPEQAPEPAQEPLLQEQTIETAQEQKTVAKRGKMDNVQAQVSGQLSFLNG